MRLRIGSKLLFLKLVALFVLFGLLVGYLSFISGTALGTYELYRSFQTGFNSHIREMIRSEEPDILYKAFVEEPILGTEITRNIEALIPEMQSDNIHLALYARHPSSKIWILLGSINKPVTELSITSEVITALDKTISSKSFFRPEIYFGQSDHRNFYIEMTDEKDKLNYVFEISFEREGFAKFIENERNTFITFTTMVLIFSLILGALFAKSISTPIKKLTDKALDLAKGEMGIRFHSKRWDDIGTLARSLDTMSLNLNHRFNSMHTMNRIDRAVLSSVSRNELLEQVAGFISEQFDNTTVSVLEHKEEGLVITALVPERTHSLGRLVPHSDLPEEFRDLNETKVLDLNIVRQKYGKNVILFPFELNKEKGVIIPILHNERAVATFAIALDKVSEQDREALEMLSDQVGVALRSKIEMEQREEMTQGTLIALTRSVDAKSRWTAGHTERVARLSIALAKKLEMSSKDIELVRISALLHDLGKLGIPEIILDKPGKLSDKEFDLIKSHPEKGDNIIKDIPGMDEVRKGVRHHHERWDGSGYPDNLKGENIPRIARIITLADVCDAISEDRPYRKGFTPEEVYKFFEEQRGSIFDPELLDSFLTVLSSAEPPL
jgi:putative nucleotidyltransferase with HDIG domain